MGDAEATEVISLSNMNTAATVIEIPVQKRVEFQAEGAATFTQDGGEFRRQMAHGVPHEIDMAENSVRFYSVNQKSMKACLFDGFANIFPSFSILRCHHR